MSSKANTSAKPGDGAVGFGSRFAAHELPHESHAAIMGATPGPGAYEPRVTEHGNSREMDGASGAMSAFAAGEIAKENKWDPKGDPGAYNPFEGRGMGDIAKTACSSAASAGKASFGATTMRELRFPPEMGRTGLTEVTPGPAAYKGSLSHRFIRSINAFRSKVPQRGQFSLPSATNPGPGSYDANFDAIEPTMPGANGISQVGRASRFVADRFLEAASGPEVGPGSYDAHLAGTISAGMGEQRTSKQTVESGPLKSEPLGWNSSGQAPVSYTHLTLPTICSV